MIIPSIDLLGGKAVRLRNGQEVIYTSPHDPVELLKEFRRYGPVAVIDIDAVYERGDHRELIAKMCRLAEVRVGGGIRDEKTARFFLRSGASQVILGTAADEPWVTSLPPERVMIALDHRNGTVMDRGWQRNTHEPIATRAKRLASVCSGFLCTFIERDGTGRGLPLEEILALRNTLSRPITVAGGTATEQEVVTLARSSIDVQVGLALHSGFIDPVQTIIKSLTFESNGLIPTIVQDESRNVLMLAYSSRESLARALREGRGIYYSRSRQEIWEKGATSGHTQELLACRADCDRDALLFTVKQVGPACHLQNESCFRTTGSPLSRLIHVIRQRMDEKAPGSYTATLFQDLTLLRNKILEEALELTKTEAFEDTRWEMADVVYHAIVWMVAKGLTWSDIEHELSGRERARQHKELP